MTIVSHYGATALFLNSFWLWPDLQPPNAGLFWSLSFEATYYAGIAFFVFARGRVRVLGLVALAVAAGSTIVLLAATWILGFWAYHFSPRQRLRGRTALILWLGSTALLFSCFLIEEHFRQPLPFLRLPDHRLGAVMAAYAAAACFAFNLVALRFPKA